MSVKNLVTFSGGVCSWAAAKRVAERDGTEGLVLLFADTCMEDEDLYRFLEEAAVNVGGRFVRVADGRTPWQVFNDERFLGNSRLDPCSRMLKRKLLDKWRDENCCQAETTISVGLDWTEKHRLVRLQKMVPGWRYEAPMCDRPLLTKDQQLDWLRANGIEPPRLYGMGFPHNNCGGFCIKAGIGHFVHLLKTMPERYAYHEEQERLIRLRLGDVSILRDRRKGHEGPLTLRALRERHQGGDKQLDLLDWGGCGCAIESPDAEGRG